MELFVWLMAITILLFIFLIPLAMMTGGIALIVRAIKTIFDKKA